ncbi:peroxisome biogenesis protein 6 [Dorcoceras hygrometricum]|uniref:Peroxisome biogenesis protein 6 n=1 Tax=Dorcoceras hygrometricum TaxID=472368 RepID=A0A2Z7DC48_9LAMI|nr:peroxisome biogenesis protein 6 [Dorcoceras hygrometricum]
MARMKEGYQERDRKKSWILGGAKGTDFIMAPVTDQVIVGKEQPELVLDMERWADSLCLLAACLEDEPATITTRDVFRRTIALANSKIKNRENADLVVLELILIMRIGEHAPLAGSGTKNPKSEGILASSFIILENFEIASRAFFLVLAKSASCKDPILPQLGLHSMLLIQFLLISDARNRLK